MKHLYYTFLLLLLFQGQLLAKECPTINKGTENTISENKVIKKGITPSKATSRTAFVGCQDMSTQWETPVPTITTYGFGGGWITGIPDPTNLTNFSDGKGIYERYTTPNPGVTSIEALRIGLGSLIDPNDNTTINIVVFDDNGFGAPGVLVGSETGISPTSLGVPGLNMYEEYTISFTTPPVPTTNSFHVGVHIFAGDATDTLIVMTSCLGAPNCPTPQGEADSSNHIFTSGFGYENLNTIYGANFDVYIIPVLDDTAPTAICNNPTIQLDATGNASITAANIDNGSTDNCSIASTSIDMTAFDCSNIGTNNVVLTVIDNSGNSSTCSSVITIEDNIQPNVICQNITVQLDATGNATITPAQIDNGSTDACGITSTILNRTTFDCTDIGTNNVVLTVTDNNGNSDTCTAVVTVQDTVLPTVICQNITVQLDATGNATITPAQIDNGSTDACGITSTILNRTTFDCTDIGTNNVVLTVTDINGNSNTCTSTVTVTETVPPIAICKDITVNLEASGSISISPSDLDNGSSDDCGTITFTADKTAFTCNDLGINTVTLTVTDIAGNTTTCTSNVTVLDLIAPTITCPLPITVDQDTNTCGAIVNFATPVDGSLQINTGTLASGPSLTTSGGSTNWASVAYNPDLDIYYSFRAGNTGMPFRTYDTTGATLTTNTTGFDFRGMWWNPNTKQLQGNGVGTSGYRTVTLDANGYATNGGTNFVTGLHQPNNQSNGAYDYNNNEVVFYHNGRLYTYDLNGNQLTDNAIVNFPEASNGDITTRSVGYTGIPGKEIIIYSELNARVYFIDKATATYNGDFINMPAGAPTPNHYGFSYANGYVFLREDASADAWVSYEIVIDDRLDNCDGTTITQTSGLVSGSLFPIGTSTVEFTAEDVSGNQTTCSFDIIVNDVTAPTPMCQNITAQLDATGNVTITPSQIDNGSTDECSIDTLTLNIDTFDCTHIGTNTVELTVTDPSGNSSTCTAVVTVQDTVLPTVICQNITVQLDATGNATITPTQIDNGSTDACGIIPTALDITAFDCTNIGTNNVVLTVTDNNGNSNTCTATVTVSSSLEIDVLGNTISIADGDTTPDTTDHTNFPSILSGNSVTNTFTIDNSTGTNPLNITNITLTGTGASAYSLGTLPTTVPAGTSTTFDVTFSSATVGTHDATITIASNDCDEAIYDFSITGEVGNLAETLNFDGTNDYAIANINSASDDFTIEAWFKADSGANGYRAIAVWQKTGPNRETSIEVRGNGVIRLGQYDYGNSNWQQVFSTTNVKDDQWHHVAAVKSGNEWTLYIDGVPEGTLTLNANNNAYTGLTDFRVGNIILNNGKLKEHFRGEIDEVRLWNSARTCKEIVNNMGCELTGTEPDLRAYYNFNHGVAGGYNPSETTLTDQTTNGFDATLTNFTLNNAVSNWISPGSGVSTTGCTVVAPEIEVTGNAIVIANNDTTPDTADDTDFGTISSGSTQTNTFTIRNAGGTTLNVSGITVAGAEFSSGTLTFPIAIPANNTQDVAITFTPTACGSANFTGSVSIDSDDCIDPTFTFDISGAEQDDVLPTMICQNITVQLDATGNVTITPAQIDNGSTDACGIATTALDITTFDCTNIGTNNVVLTVTDNNGNSNTCNAVVTVQDIVLPTVVCQNITRQLDATGNITITATDVDGGSTDACGIASTVLDITTFDCTDIGTNNVVLTVTDNNGNSDTCTAVVTVQDTVLPTVICQDITVQLDASGNATIIPAQIDNGSTDACGIASTVLDITTFDCTDIGTNNVVLTVTDNNGNSDTCTAVVTVQDTVLPTVVCQNITVQLDATGNATITPAQIDIGSTDACGIATTALDITTFDCTHIGTNNVVLTVTDNNGNSDTCTAVVTLQDTVLPTVVCQNITRQLDATGNITITATDVDGGSTDACGIATTALDITTFDCTHIGTNNVVLTVTDNNGNSNTCTAIVTIQDTVFPTVVCQNITRQLDPTGNITITATDVDGGSLDACGIASYTLDTYNFNCSNIGVNTVTLTVTDTNGNSSNCTATVTIEDTTLPIANIPVLLPVYEACSLDIITAPTATDNCANTITGTTTTTFPIQVSTTITWNFDDGNGNSITQDQEITIEDTFAPIPDNLSLEEVNVTCILNNLPTPTANDECAGEVTATTITTFPITTSTEVIWTYTDGANTSTQNQQVIIHDSTPVDYTATGITNGTGDKAAITVNLTGSRYANYEVQLDDEQWVLAEKEGSSFTITFANVFIPKDGLQMVNLRSTDGCWQDSLEIYLVGYRGSFTPNGDGIHDSWNMIGLTNSNPNASITIFNRLGKLIAQIKPSGPGWDGTYNGIPVPSSEYWFKVSYFDSDNNGNQVPKNISGHFSLIR